MVKLQDWFDQNNPKDKINIYLNGEKLKEQLKGSELIIENFTNLEDIKISGLPELRKIVIKNCEELKGLIIYLKSRIETELIGNFPNLKSFKCHNDSNHSVIIQQKPFNKPCWTCWFWPFIILWMLCLTIMVYRKAKK